MGLIKIKFIYLPYPSPPQCHLKPLNTRRPAGTSALSYQTMDECQPYLLYSASTSPPSSTGHMNEVHKLLSTPSWPFYLSIDRRYTGLASYMYSRSTCKRRKGNAVPENLSALKYFVLTKVNMTNSCNWRTSRSRILETGILQNCILRLRNCARLF